MNEQEQAPAPRTHEELFVVITLAIETGYVVLCRMDLHSYGSEEGNAGFPMRARSPKMLYCRIVFATCVRDATDKYL